MTRFILVLIASLIALTLAPVLASRAQEAPPPQFAPPQCVSPTQLFTGLAQIGEAPAIVGVGPRGSTGLLSRNPDTTTWTFILVSPEGCLLYVIGGDKSATVEKKPGVPM